MKRKMKYPLPLDKMSLEEKLETMETIWEELCKNDAEIPSPKWHKNILEEREKNLQNGTEESMDWEKARKHIQDSIS